MAQKELLPSNDFAFKKVFGDEKNKPLLIELINNIVSEKDKIDDLDILNPELLGYSLQERIAVLDIRAKAKNSNRRYGIEVQVRTQPFYSKRALFYWSKMYSSQAKAEEFYTTLEKTIGIHIVNFIHFEEFGQYHSIFKVRNTKHPEKTIENLDHFEMHFLELPKFKKGLKDLSPGLDKWMEFIKNASKYDSTSLPKELSSQEKLKETMETFERIKFTEEEQRAYDALLKQMMDEEARMTSAVEKAVEKAAKKGEKLGLEKGREEGKKEGEKLGLEKGRKQEKLLLAKSLKAKGMSEDEIIELTGLTPNDLKDQMV